MTWLVVLCSPISATAHERLRRQKEKLTICRDSKIELSQQMVVFGRESEAEAGECPVDNGTQSGLERGLNNHR